MEGAEHQKAGRTQPPRGQRGCQPPKAYSVHCQTPTEYFPTCTTPRELQEKDLTLSFKHYQHKLKQDMCKTRKSTLPKGRQPLAQNSSLFSVHGKSHRDVVNFQRTLSFTLLPRLALRPQSWWSVFPLANEKNLVTHLMFHCGDILFMIQPHSFQSQAKRLVQTPEFPIPPYNLSRKRLILKGFYFKPEVSFQKPNEGRPWNRNAVVQPCQTSTGITGAT